VKRYFKFAFGGALALAASVFASSIVNAAGVVPIPADQPRYQSEAHVADLAMHARGASPNVYSFTVDWLRPDLSTRAFDTPLASYRAWAASENLMGVTFPLPWGPGNTGPGNLLPNQSADRIWPQFPDRYLIMFRNITNNEQFNLLNPLAAIVPPVQMGRPWNDPPAFNEPWFDNPLAMPPALNQNLHIPPPRVISGTVDRTLEGSSLYEVSIEPRRFAPFMESPGAAVGGTGAIWIPSWLPAPVERITSGPDALVNGIILTDIEIINMEAQGDEIIVDFVHPGNIGTPGNQLIDAWHVSWFPLDRPADPLNPAPLFPSAGPNWGYAQVPEVDLRPSPMRPQGSTRNITRAVISGVNLQAAEEIVVRIEPVQNGVLLREPVVGPHRVTAGGRTFIFASRPISTDFFVSEPRMVAPRLFLDVIGDNIRLNWSSLGGMLYAQRERVEVQEYRGGVWVTIGTITGTQPTQLINEWILPIGTPRVTRTFRVAIIPSNMNPISNPIVFTNEVVYDPTTAFFDPYAPVVQQAIATANNVTGVGTINDLEFLAFAREPFTFNEETSLNNMRDANGELIFDPSFIDTNLLFHIYVTDEFELLGSFSPDGLWIPGQLVNQGMHLHAIPGSQLFPPRSVVLDHVDTPIYRLPFNLSQFTPRGAESPINLVGNRSYTIMIYAIRTNALGEILFDNDGNMLVSNPAFYSVFMPPFGPIELPPEMIASPPFRAGEPEPERINLLWDLRYFEIAQPGQYVDGAIIDVWHSGIGIRDGEIVFGRDAVNMYGATVQHTIINDIIGRANPDLLARLRSATFNPSNAVEAGDVIRQATAIVNAWLADNGITSVTPPITLRIQDMNTQGNIPRNWIMHTVTLAHMMSVTDETDDLGLMYLEYFDRFLSDSDGANPAVWLRVPHTALVVENGIAGFSITNANAPPGAITPNTPYVIFLLPMESFQHGNLGELQAFMPSHILVTTPDTGDRIPPTPTVPVLIPVLDPAFTTDHSVGVRWRLLGGLDDRGVPNDMHWDLAWDETWLTHPDGGNDVPWAEIVEAILDPDNPSGIWIDPATGYRYIRFRIPGLFLDTDHYVWGWAQSTDGNNTSLPANPVTIRTLNISPPAPPRSLGTASAGLISTYNRLTNSEIDVNDPEALNITFMRIFADLNLGEPRATAGTATGGTASTLDLPALDEFMAQHIIRFENLRPNTRYFVRARTILTVSRAGAGEVNRVYSYEIEIADNSDFLDSIRFVIPATTIAAPNDPNVRQAFSPWVSIQVDTALGEGEFDGVFRPDQFPLPERDFEIVYDPRTQTLSFRFRTNQIGADGRPDQNVDQRFISRLVTERTFTYTVDMSEYWNNPLAPIANRNLTIPLSIIRAFDERRITLEVDAGDIVYVIPPGAFNTAETRALQPGVGSYFVITLASNPEGMPVLSANMSHAIPPQRLTVSARTPNRTVNMNTFARPIDIVFPMDNHVTPHGESASLFRSGAGVAGWQDMNGRYSFATNSVTSQTSTPGIFTGVVRQAPPSTGGNNAVNNAMTRVTSNINITDLFSFNPNQAVSATAFNNIINAVANRSTTVTMAGSLSAADSQALSRANLLASNNLTREAAVDIIVRLYERQTRQSLTPMSTLSSIPGGSGTGSAFQRNVRIASDLGMISGPFAPQGSLTMGELMVMLDILIQDAGW